MAKAMTHIRTLEHDVANLQQQAQPVILLRKKLDVQRSAFGIAETTFFLDWNYSITPMDHELTSRPPLSRTCRVSVAHSTDTGNSNQSLVQNQYNSDIILHKLRRAQTELHTLMQELDEKKQLVELAMQIIDRKMLDNMNITDLVLKKLGDEAAHESSAVCEALTITIRGYTDYHVCDTYSQAFYN